MEQRGMASSIANSLYNLMGRSIGVVERLSLKLESLLATSYSCTLGGWGEGR